MKAKIAELNERAKEFADSISAVLSTMLDRLPYGVRQKVVEEISEGLVSLKKAEETLRSIEGLSKEEMFLIGKVHGRVEALMAIFSKSIEGK